ncbi:hypothetical protein PYCCODRAFT_1434700 [Trametes coccinea BRFM310]|uniref:DUF6534 domain-containing protein n=1 Tax=Trametes coccinea (strain BRFM310) TaxID=1353009 RepID=A0A1Y2IRH9_TRAC3|nr:hypothetical protein PYCCODRAFT_1434700 [Trametes coccinea BRFM310]
MDLANISLDNTFGAVYIGAVLGACMYGVTTLQTYTYFGRCSADNMYLKSMVFLLWIVDTVHAALVTRSMYTYLVTDITNVLAVFRPIWSLLPATVVLTAFNNFLVRGILCYRIWHFSGRNRYLAFAIALSVLVTCGSTIAYAILTAHIASWFDLYKLAWLFITSFSWSIVADLLITAALCVLLIRKRTGFERSDNILRKLVIYSVNTGLLTSLCALVCLVTYTTMPDNFIFMACYCVYPKLILNCLLATLNGRSGLHKLSASHEMDSLSEFAKSRAVQNGREDTENRAGRDVVTVINIGFVPSGEESTRSNWLNSQVDSEAAEKATI